MVTSPEMDAVTDTAAAEAAAWLARLQGPQRTEAAEAAFKAWLKADPGHARAFARATDAWELVLGAARMRASEPKKKLPVRTMAMALAACLAIAVATPTLIAPRLAQTAYDTAAGEQQTVILDDGTRVALNTNSRILVDYRPGERRVRLIRGEAMFYVAHNPHRPFTVMAGDEQVKALGTTFIVRRDPSKTSVTLVEGRVEIANFKPLRMRAPRQVAVLTPGERLVVRTDPAVVQAAVLDRPKVETVAAWRRGQVIFDNTPLGEAVAEMNRYGGRPVRIADAGLGGLRVSGVFETADAAEFASAVAELHGLSLTSDATELSLARGPVVER